MNITKTSVEKLPIPAATQEGKTTQKKYYDDKLKGFGVRVTSGGTKAFFVEKRLKDTGKLKRITIARYPELTVEQARKEAQIYIGKMVTGIDPSPKTARKAHQAATELETLHSTSLEQAFKDYLDQNKKLKQSTIKDYQSVVYYCLDKWLQTPLNQITDNTIREMHDHISLTSKARANYAMRIMRAVFNFAIRYYKTTENLPIFTYNPTIALKGKWHTIERRQTIIKGYQLKDWFKAVNDLQDDAPNSKAEITKDYLLLLIFTGLRRQEAAQLKWIDIDFHDKSIKITETKNRKTHLLPCSDFIFELLRKRREKCLLESPESPYVFPSNSSASGHIVEPKKQIAKIVEKSGVQFCIHDLRRSFATYAHNLEIPHFTIKKMLNHSMKDDVTKGYIVPSVEQLRAPIQKISNYIIKQST